MMIHTMPAPRKRPCSICRQWFRPNARVGSLLPSAQGSGGVARYPSYITDRSVGILVDKNQNILLYFMCLKSLHGRRDERET
jgi:hypothetical protein